MKYRGFVIITAIVGVAGLAYAGFDNGRRQPVDFYTGHTHKNGITIGAPAHSGGTDKYGCHNGSVPYHCH